LDLVVPASSITGPIWQQGSNPTGPF